jgi:hypothetical protein
VDVRYGSGLCIGYRGEHRWHQWSKDRCVVAPRMHNDYGKSSLGEILLILEVAINREQEVKLPGCQLQQFTVLCTGPADLSNSLD